MSTRKSRPLPQGLGMPFTGADTHAHLDDEALLPDLGGVLARAAGAGVSFIVHMFLRHSSYAAHAARILEAASAPGMPAVRFARGLHPEDVRDAGEEEWGNLVRAVRNDPAIAAVGEIGMDFHYEEGYSPSDRQEFWFRRQLVLARELGKPVVIHSRDAWEETFAILDEEDMGGRPLLWHCFGGGPDMVRRILDRGWHVALGGASTFPANAHIREALKSIPLDRLVFETDCPYLAPVPWRGKPCEPALSVFTAACAADVLGMDAAELWTIAGDNARRFFGLS